MPPVRPQSAPVRRPLAVLLCIVAAAAGLRFAQLDRESLWYDELIMARITDGALQKTLMEVFSGRPALYPLTAWAWTAAWGRSEFALRSLSAVAGLLAVPLTYLLGRRLFDSGTGLLAATLMATSAFMIHYSQEHRYYALYLLLSLASLICLAEALRQPRRRWFAGFVLCSVLAYYSQYFALFTMMAGLVAVALVWPGLSAGARRGYVVSLACIVVGILPGLLWPWMWLHAPTLSGTWRETPPWWSPIKTSLHFLFLAYRHTPVGSLAAATGLGAIALAGWIRRRGGSRWLADLRRWPVVTLRLARRRRTGVVLLACWWLLPMLAMLAASWLKPMYVDRYLIASAPAMMVLLAAGMWSLRRVLHPALTLLVVLTAMAGSVWTLHTHVLKDQWREAARTLARQAQPGDTLAFTSYRGKVFESLNVSQNLRWYWPYRQRGLHVDITQPDRQWIAQLRQAAGTEGRVWLVMIVWADEDMPANLVERIQSVSDGPEIVERWTHYRACLLLLRFPADGRVIQSDSG